MECEETYERRREMRAEMGQFGAKNILSWDAAGRTDHSFPQIVARLELL